jgi:hypothetical protein
VAAKATVRQQFERIAGTLRLGFFLLLRIQGAPQFARPRRRRRASGCIYSWS